MKDGWTAETSDLRLRLEEWPEGYYLFAVRKSEQVSFHDELQDTLIIAMAAAKEEFGVDPSDWRQELWPSSLR